MKKFLSLLTSIFFSAFLVLSLLPNAFAANTSMQLSTNHPQTYTAYPSNNPIYVEGTQINTIPIYNINNSNYFKLRDIGYLMDFGVSWNTSKKCIEINTSKSSDGLQVSTHQATQAKTASISNQPIYIDNVLYKDMTVYKIDDNNYFKLRDLADKVDFSCIYDSTTHSVSLDSRFHYSFKNVRGIKKDLTNYQYYDSYSSVPDFGNITGSSLYLDSGKNEKGIMYWYDIDWDANYDGIAIYKDILKANRFYYRTTVTDDDNQNIDIFEGNGLAIMCGFHQGRYVIYIVDDSNTDDSNTETITPATIKSHYSTYRESRYAPDFGAAFDLEPTFQYNSFYFYDRNEASQYVDQYRNILTKCGFTRLEDSDINDALGEEYVLIIGNDVPVMISLSYTDASFKILVTTR